MAYYAVDQDGTEWVFTTSPYRWPCKKADGHIEDAWMSENHSVNLTSGTIEKIIGRPLTWADDAVEI